MGDDVEFKLENIKGVGPQTIKILKSLHIRSTYDLVLTVPKGYEDFQITLFKHAKNKELVTVRAKVLNTPRLIRGQKVRVSFQAEIEESSVEVIAFGRGYLTKTLEKQSEILIKGVYHLYRHQIVATSITKLDHANQLKPIYHIESIHDRTINQIVKEIFEQDQVKIYEILPEDFVKNYRLISRKEAYRLLHLPNHIKDVKRAQLRLKYEEAFFLQLKLQTQRPDQELRHPKPYRIDLVKQLIQTLPFELTEEQKEATNDVFRDFKSKTPTYRLIQGDVGSGKTMVALIAAYAITTAGEQVAIMAPTELLARQHFITFKTYLKNTNIALLSSRMEHKEVIKQSIKTGEAQIIIGTHALIQSDVIFDRLGFVIIDEQHKFGVTSRTELIAKASQKDLLYLTATPIPRTLAMLAFGNANISIISQKPQERLSILTRYILKNELDALYQAISSALIRKEHVILIVPAIDSNKKTDTIESVYISMRSEFPNTPIFILHGRLHDQTNEQTMENYIHTPGSILISTTMLEVGIDIPTATLIGIYSAESFGLSQLHQLRGRVGRSHLASQCILISEKEDIERLEVLTQTDDGFKLAEFDLIERGPGDFVGLDQSGHIELKYLDLMKDDVIVKETQNYIASLISKPDFLTNPKYKYLIEAIKDGYHMM